MLLSSFSDINLFKHFHSSTTATNNLNLLLLPKDFFGNPKTLHKMEFKVRKESQTLMEKVFNAHERRGTIRAYQIGSMLRSLHPELAVDPEELKNQITTNDPDGVGNFDFDSFNRVAMHFLLKQSRRESDGFISKHEIGLNDFPTL